MNLKITPKEAVQLIDALVKQGSDLLQLVEHHELLSEFKRRREAEKRKENPKEIFINQHGTPQEKRPCRKDLKVYKQRFSEWEENVQNILRSIYKDFSPVFQFKRIEGDYNLINKKQTAEFKTFLIITSKLEKQLTFLIAAYQSLITFLTSPLFYIKESAKIVYYDKVIELSPNTNQSRICDYMFDLPIGQGAAYENIYGYFNGQSAHDTSSWEKNWKKEVQNAFEGVNDKARDNFKFPIFFSKNKELLYIKI